MIVLDVRRPYFWVALFVLSAIYPPVGCLFGAAGYLLWLLGHGMEN